VPWACSVVPDCGGNLGEARREIVSITDITAEPRPEVRRYAVETRDCGQCGRKVRGQHPEIAPGQQGATAHRWGHTSRRWRIFSITCMRTRAEDARHH